MHNTPLVIYGISNCDTVKRARAWLAGHDQSPVFHDFKKVGVPPTRLAAWVAAQGCDQVLNRRGTTWRRLTDAERVSVVDDAAAIALLERHPSLVKRPIVEWRDTSITVGFDEAEWARRLGV